MGAKIIKNGKLTTTLNLDGLESYIKALKGIDGGDILEKAALHLQRKAINAMKEQYLKTASNRIDYNRSRKAKAGKHSIVERLFSDVPVPLKKGNKVVEFQFWAGYGALSSDLPHLRWQEEGTATNIDRQPYEITRFRPGNKGRLWKLRSITKSEASNRPSVLGLHRPNAGYKVRDRKGRYTPGDSVAVGSIYNIRVVHPALKPRNFIAAGNFLIKSQGNKIVTDFVKSEIRKRINNA